MKALSVKQPYAELIARGTKRIEYRSWFTEHRGPLLIVASASRQDDECRTAGLDPDTLVYGAAVCVVELDRISGSDGTYSWHLSNPRRVEPVSIRGYASIYHVDDAQVRVVGAAQGPTVEARASQRTNDRALPAPGPSTERSRRMPTYRFSWKNFDDATVAALASAIGGPSEIDRARDWLAASVKRPHPDFVRATKDVLARVWLPKYPGIGRELYELLYDMHIGPLGRPRSDDGYARYVDQCKNTKTVQRLLCEALIRFGDMDRTEASDDIALDGIRRFARLEPKKQGEDGRKPHPHQREAWQKLDAHLAESEGTGVFQGVLVMPTGSGKTYTASHWLLRNVVDRGGRVLWLAHRHELLNQAAREFGALSGLASRREALRMRVVSAVHCRAHQIDPADDIILCSIGSLARNPQIVEKLVADPKLFLVVDEAHHAPAKSYRDVLERLLKQKKRRILGITATPTRTTESERPILARLFGERTIHEIGLRELIERNILARPIPVRVDTGVNADAGATTKDLEHVARFGELSEEMLDRIGKMSARNELIIGTYARNASKYGKTLVFAVNVTHAALLAERFREAGVAADYVASWCPDGVPRDNLELIRRFREPGGGLDVLVNVDMMTEGVDVPCVQTVFLARPTKSEILLRQMIGRALRGTAAGGNERAYLVSFEDHWERFPEWDSLLDLVPDIVPPTAPQTPNQPPPAAAEPEVTPPWEDVGYSWDQVRQVARAVRQLGIGQEADAYESVPHGLYILEHDADGEPTRLLVSVYEHQRACWEAMLASLDSASPDELAALDAERLFDEYFFDCEPVRPSNLDIEQMLEHYRALGGRPEYRPLEERSACDPHVLARKILDEDMGPRKRDELLVSRYTGLARIVYPTLRDFGAAIEDAIHELQHPEDKTQAPRGRPMFEPPPDAQLRPGPAHDLEALFREVIERGRALLGHDLVHAGELAWSRRPIKGWYGKAFYEPHTPHGHGTIRINCLLNSPDVSAETLRFLLWHEYLHLFLKSLHTKEFREKERLWPGWVDCDRELDSLNERFGVQYW